MVAVLAAASAATFWGLKREYDDSENRWQPLMLAAQAGDEEAYKALLEDLTVALRAYLRHRFALEANLEDCVQECLIAIHKARHTYDASRPFRPWMFTIARHRTIDLLRAQPDHVPLDDIDAQPDRYDPALTIDTSSMLGSLSTSLREPLYLTKYMGLSNKECADRLGISEATVKIRVFRAIRRLRGTWNEA